jgi:hypothetical protein
VPAVTLEAGIPADALLSQIGRAARSLQDARLLLPEDSALRVPLWESQARLHEMVVVNLEELCADVILECQRAGIDSSSQTSAEAGEAPLTSAYERAMKRYETEVSVQVQQIITLVGAEGQYAQRTWEAAAFCLFCLVAIWPWEKGSARAEVMRDAAREHLPADSRMLQRIEEGLARQHATIPSLPIAQLPPHQEKDSPVELSPAPDENRLLPLPRPHWRPLLLASLVFLAALAAFMIVRWRMQAEYAMLETHLQQRNTIVLQVKTELDALESDGARIDAQLIQLKRLIDESERKEQLDRPIDETAYQRTLSTYNGLIMEKNDLDAQKVELDARRTVLISEYNRLARRYNTLKGRKGGGMAPLLELIPLKE